MRNYPDAVKNASDYSKTAGAERIVTIREAALLEGIDLTMGDRNKSYGAPNINLTKMAMMLRGYFNGRHVSSFTSADMAAIMILAKLSRIAGNQTHHDSWVDAAVYAAIGLECAEQNGQGKPAQDED